MKPRELKQWRQKQHLSQTALAQLLNCHYNTVAYWERGVHRMPGHVELALEAIAQQRAVLVRKLNAKRAEILARRRIKFADQHPEHYLKLLENVRKARAAQAARRAASRP